MEHKTVDLLGNFISVLSVISKGSNTELISDQNDALLS